MGRLVGFGAPPTILPQTTFSTEPTDVGSFAAVTPPAGGAVDTSTPSELTANGFLSQGNDQAQQNVVSDPNTAGAQPASSMAFVAPAGDDSLDRALSPSEPAQPKADGDHDSDDYEAPGLSGC